MTKHYSKIIAAFRDKPPSLMRWGRATTPHGPMLVGMMEDGTVCRLTFAKGEGAGQVLKAWRRKWPQTVLVEDAHGAEQMARRIFSGKKSGAARTIRVRLDGTPFQRQVWKALLGIPAGRVASYGEIARRIKRPKAARAVGRALSANPVLVLVPCHRVIAANGSLGGYLCGQSIKKRLLKAENVSLFGYLRPARKPRFSASSAAKKRLALSL
ncbi:MAG: methylated-DNA--[protein]-cysteine S-methyltransferase [Alphaproteobacteria bacterium]|nr:methylated-DNA--[protein]-cysteine S-methyltransferase [Alphaproteobacteria bacterium]